MWGQEYSPSAFFTSDGIIPTRVGTSFASASSTDTGWDHPHACGDKASKLCVKQRFRGSSPRVWGQVVLYHKGYQVSGIIPTRVGTSFSRCTATQSMRDHPHACGDKKYPLAQRLSLQGSSPRVWGQESTMYVMLFRQGIIPTRVGTRWRTSASALCAWDHPHACGDK